MDLKEIQELVTVDGEKLITDMKFLYILRSTAGLVKVGIATDVHARRRALEFASGLEISVISTFGPFFRAAGLEALVHRELEAHRTIGEWFACEPDRAVNAVCTAMASFEDHAVPQCDGGGLDDLVRAAAAETFGPIFDLQNLAEQLLRELGDSIAQRSDLADQLIEAAAVIEGYESLLQQCMEALEIANKRMLNRELAPT